MSLHNLKKKPRDVNNLVRYFIILRLFPYLILDQVEVTEAKDFDPGAHWDYSSEEDDKDDSGESVYETEEEDDDDDDEDED